MILFSVEEWGLFGSQAYVKTLSEEEKRRIAMVVNLDTVVGHRRLHALTANLDDVQAFVHRVSQVNGVPITPIRPVLANSDHYNFFLAGIPALRLIAGYEEPTSLTRYLLSSADTRDKVDPGQLRIAAMTAACLVIEASAGAERPGRYRSAEEIDKAIQHGEPRARDRLAG